jgi:Mn-dependent DtxR family transcriptional regulator
MENNSDGTESRSKNNNGKKEEKKTEENFLTQTMEDYIETIYLLSQPHVQKNRVRVSDIARKLNVAKSSVHIALHTLSDKDYITHKKYGAVYLTERGIKTAEEIYKCHVQLKNFFETVLNLDSETAEKDACAAEHVLSHKAVQAITELVNKIGK